MARAWARESVSESRSDRWTATRWVPSVWTTGHLVWPYLALIGSGVYQYFSAVTMLSRVYLKRRGKRVGRVTSVTAAYIWGLIWIVCSLAMTAAAIAELSS